MNDAQTLGGERQTRSIPTEITAAPVISTPSPQSSSGDVTLSEAPTLKSEHGEFAAFHQGYVWSAISLADTKAAWSFAVCAGMIAYLLARAPIQSLVLSLPWTAASLLFAAALFCLGAGALFAFLVIVPRLGASPEGLVYFGAVARRHAAETYVFDVGRSTPDALTRARLTHTFDTSRIADRKYRHLRASMWSALAGLTCAAIFIALGWTTVDTTSVRALHQDRASAADHQNDAARKPDTGGQP